jgi:hypothetical protein
MKQQPSLGDRGPFLIVGVLCWLCGAVVVGVGTQLLFGWITAVVAVVVVSAFVLGVVWSLSSSAPAGSRRA